MLTAGPLSRNEKVMTQRDFEVWFSSCRLGLMSSLRFGTSLVALFCIFVTGCGPSLPRGEGSILIVAISNFRADDLGCGLSGDSITPQLDLICQESIRFTHAYTPSTLGVPALASIFTG